MFEIGPAIAATSSAANASPISPTTTGPGNAPTSFADDVSPYSCGVAATADDASAFSCGIATSSSGSGAPDAATGPAMSSPATFHVDVPPLLAFLASTDTFAPIAPTGPAGPIASDSVTAAAVASVFSSASGFSSGFGSDSSGGSFVVSELPFTHDMSFDDTPVYTTSNDTPWILMADSFDGDGWFFA
jgi:hypothetical protein